MSRKILLIKHTKGRLTAEKDSFSTKGAEFYVFPPEKVTEELAGSRFDLIFIADGQDRLSLLSQLRSQRPETPIVVVTRDSSWRAARDALRAGAADVLAEPLRRRKLVSAIQRILI